MEQKLKELEKRITDLETRISDMLDIVGEKVEELNQRSVGTAITADEMSESLENFIKRYTKVFEALSKML